MKKVQEKKRMEFATVVGSAPDWIHDIRFVYC